MVDRAIGAHLEAIVSAFFRLNSVGGKIATAFALILPALFYAFGSDAWNAWTRSRSVQVMEQQNAAANNLIAGVYEILMERLAMNNALQADDRRARMP